MGTKCQCGTQRIFSDSKKTVICPSCDLPKINPLLTIDGFKTFCQNCRSRYGDLMLIVCEITGRPLVEHEVNRLTDFLHATLLEQVSKCEQAALKTLFKQEIVKVEKQCKYCHLVTDQGETCDLCREVNANLDTDII